MKYKLINQFGWSGILRIEDSSIIPFDPANTDYQAYLKWVDEGNTPQPADKSEPTSTK